MKYAVSKLERFFGTDIRSLAHGGFWLSIGTLVSILVGLALSFAYARYLTKDAYGSYRYALSLISIVGISSLSGVGIAITRSVARGFEGSFVKNSKIIFLSSLGISLVSLVAAGWYFLENNLALASSFLIAALIIPFVEGLGSWRGYLNGKQEFQRKTFYNSVAQLVYGLVMGIVVFAVYKWNIPLYPAVAFLVGTYMLGHAIPNAFFYLKTLRSISPHAKEDPESVRLGLHLSLSNIPATIATYLDSVLLFHFLGPAALAVYSFAIVFPEQLKSLFGNIATAVFPKLSLKTVDTESREIFRATLVKKLLKASLFTGAVIVLYIALSPFMYKWFFPRYIESTVYSQIFALSLVLFPFGILGDTLKAEGNIRTIYIHSIGTPILQIVVLVALIPFFGLWGAVIGRIIGRLLNHLLALVLFYKRPPAL